jgi:anthraniloyl-CoA monooxygenase
VRIVTVGGGPAGLYFSLLMKKADPSNDVTVIERNAPEATFGWGVVFSDETLGSLRDADRPTYDEIADSFARWSAIDVVFRGETVRSRGHVFTAIARTRLLAILQARCRSLGVELRFEEEVPDAFELATEADVVAAADGVHSGTRARREEIFTPTIDVHRTRYIWFGADLVFRAFTFVFRETEHGMFQVHGYPFDADTSTFIVETPESVWHAAGLEDASESESIAFCQELFAETLGRHRLMSNRSTWINFLTVRCESWHDGNVVLLGDAAHTAHFTIGSGTKLAMEDAISLAEQLQRRGGDVRSAIVDYELGRQSVVERFQQAALESSRYFENVRRYAGFEPVRFAFNLLTRSGRITHLELEKRDADFVARVDSSLAGTGTSPAAPPPALTPLHIRHDNVTNRVTSSTGNLDDATDGRPDGAAPQRFRAAALTGAGLVVTGFVSVSPEGRMTPGTPGLYDDRSIDAWRTSLSAAREGEAMVAVRIGHAGPRASTRPPVHGADRALRDGQGWEVVSASAVGYGPASAVPGALDDQGIAKVLDDHAAAARRAAAIGFDAIELDMAHGHLLGAFLSPLTNRRTDEFGGPLEHRARLPLGVLTRVRAVWDGPLIVAYSVTDWQRGGLPQRESVEFARMLKAFGADLIHVQAGQTTWWSRPEYGRLHLVPYSDVIRNEAAVPTLVGGGIRTRDEVNTIVAAGRADLCLLAPR